VVAALSECHDASEIVEMALTADEGADIVNQISYTSSHRGDCRRIRGEVASALQSLRSG